MHVFSDKLYVLKNPCRVLPAKRKIKNLLARYFNVF